MIKLIVVLVSVFFVFGCTAPMMVKEMPGEVSGTTIQFIDSGVDMAGGPRIRQMIVYDRNGNIIAGSHGVGAGTWQTSVPTLGSLANTTIQGYYFNEGMKNLRPPEYNSSTTVVGGDVVGEGATGPNRSTSLNANAEGGNAQGGSSSSSSGSTSSADSRSNSSSSNINLNSNKNNNSNQNSNPNQNGGSDGNWCPPGLIWNPVGGGKCVPPGLQK